MKEGFDLADRGISGSAFGITGFVHVVHPVATGLVGAEEQVFSVGGPCRAILVSGRIDLGIQVFGSSPGRSGTFHAPDVSSSVPTATITVEVKVAVNVARRMAVADAGQTSVYPVVAGFASNVDVAAAGEVEVASIGADTASVLVGGGINGRAEIFSGLP